MTANAPPMKDKPFSVRDAALEAYALHPHISAQVFFIDGTDNTVHHPDPAMALWASGVANLDFGIRGVLYARGKDRMSVAAHALCGVRYVVMYPDNPLEQLYGKLMPETQRQYFTFDHELGHAIVRPGTEQAADAYAALRHVQRFGYDTKWIRRVSLGRALGAASQPSTRDAIDHYTSPILRRVVELAGTRDLTLLTPQQTIALAEKIVQDVNMTPVPKLRDAFSKAFAGYSPAPTAANDNIPAEERIMALADTVMTTKDDDVYTCGSIVLQSLLDGKINHKDANGHVLYLHGEKWDGLRGRFNRHAKDRRTAKEQARRHNASIGPSYPKPKI